MVSDVLELVLVAKRQISLNPYSTGRWFLIQQAVFKSNEKGCLNPYSTGRWFLIMKKKSKLELLEQSLNPYSTGRWFLILSNN